MNVIPQTDGLTRRYGPDLSQKTGPELEALIRLLGEKPKAKISKKALIAQLEAIPLWKIRLERLERDALRRQPRMLIEHAGISRYHRRHRVSESRGLDGQVRRVVRTIKPRWRKPATNVPATRRDVFNAYASIA